MVALIDFERVVRRVNEAESAVGERVADRPENAVVLDEVLDDLFVLTRAPEDAPEIPASVELAFERAIPVSINGVEMSPVELIQSLQTIAGAHGIGRTVSNAGGEGGARVIHEAPAALALHTAYAVLQDREAGVVHLTFHKGECRIRAFWIRREGGADAEKQRAWEIELKSAELAQLKRGQT